MRNWSKEDAKRYDEKYKLTKYTHSLLDDFFEKYPQFNDRKLKVLDLACGVGYLSQFYDDYTGVDFSLEVIERNKKTLNGLYYHASLEELEFLKGEKYDVVFLNDVMEHIPVQFTGSVLRSVADLDFKEAYFKISKIPAQNTDGRGKNFHLTVATGRWWRSLIENYFKVTYAEDRQDRTLCHFIVEKC